MVILTKAQCERMIPSVYSTTKPAVVEVQCGFPHVTDPEIQGEGLSRKDINVIFIDVSA